VMTFKFIIVFIDTFTRFVELFPANTVCAISAANALKKHICRFCTPLEILTDQGTQFMKQTLTHLASISGIKHHVTTPYSKEENVIVERAKKEVNRQIRNILTDKDCIPDWPQILCVTEKILNSSVKQALGVSPSLVFHPEYNIIFIPLLVVSSHFQLFHSGGLNETSLTFHA